MAYQDKNDAERGAGVIYERAASSATNTVSPQKDPTPVERLRDEPKTEPFPTSSVLVVKGKNGLDDGGQAGR